MMYHALKPFLLFPKTHRNKRTEVEKGINLTTPSKGEKTGSVHNCMRVQQFLEDGIHMRICWVMNAPQRGRKRVRYNLPVRNHEMLDSELKVKHVAEQKIKWRFMYRATVQTSFSPYPSTWNSNVQEKHAKLRPPLWNEPSGISKGFYGIWCSGL